MTHRRKLTLLRHSKAAKDGTADHERQLTKAGRADASAAGRAMHDSGVRPELVVVSTSVRTRETWELAGAELEGQPAVRFEDRIYDNTVEDLLDVIRATSEEVRSLVLVGHNPSMAELAVQLDDGSGDQKARRLLAERFPTSAYAAFAVDSPWERVAPGELRLELFTTPAR